MRLPFLLQYFLSPLLAITLASFGSATPEASYGQHSKTQSQPPSLQSSTYESEDVLSPSPWLEGEEVVLQGLDKITARIFTVTARINQLVKFGTLRIYARKGYKAPPEELPESVCFLEIFECKAGEKQTLVFSGWMFASNPSLYPLEHPIYEVRVKDVKTSSLTETPPAYKDNPKNYPSLEPQAPSEEDFKNGD